jgi:hypothetical protein
MKHSDSKREMVQLFDGRQGLRAGVAVEVREPSGTREPEAAGQGGGQDHALDFIASTGAVDRFDEIIEPSGWQLDNYRRNPVFQNAHQYGDVLFTLGKALITEVRPRPGDPGSSCLFQRIQFAVEANPIARIAYGLYKGKFLNAVSVGFIPLRWEDNPRRRYLEQELLEVSAVGIPANPQALALGLKSGAIERADVRETLDRLKRLGEFGSSAGGLAPAKPQPVSSSSLSDLGTTASGLTGNEAQLLQLARALRMILRRG